MTGAGRCSFPESSRDVKGLVSIRTTIAALAVALMMVLVLWPAGASAHPGHGHSLVEKVAAKAPAASQQRAERTASAPRYLVIRAAPVLSASADRFHPGCADPNCCGDGHCLSFAGVIAPLTTAQFLDHVGFVPAGSNVSPPPSRVTEGPPRPPKTFA
jgi:hypothetical protein